MERYGLDARCVDELIKRCRLHMKWADATQPQRLAVEEVYCAAYLATALD